ncbi:MAG: hypothetical protein ACK5B9_03210 [Flavobacteriia bacterium]
MAKRTTSQTIDLIKKGLSFLQDVIDLFQKHFTKDKEQTKSEPSEQTTTKEIEHEPTFKEVLKQDEV